MKHFAFLCFSFLFIQEMTAQCPYGGSLSGIELVTNRDFSAGNTGFTSQYTYCNSYLCLYPEAYYAVGANPTFFHDAFHGVDHTTGSGNLMIVNGAGAANTEIWCETMAVQPFANYIFSYWLSSMVIQSPAQLQVSVNGTLTGSIATAPSSTYVWQQHSITWNAGTNTSVEICIVNQNTALGGNDFGLDDISFQQCVCSSAVAEAGPDQTICPGDTSQLSASGGASYAWQSSAFLSDTSVSDPSAFPLSTSTFYVTVFDSSGCSAIDSATVFVNPLPQPVTSNDTAICSGTTASLFASGGISYAWSPSSTLSDSLIADPIAQPDTFTTYIVTVTDALGCKATDSVHVGILPLPQVVVSSDTTICKFTSATLIASGGITYSWSNNAAGDTIIVEPLSNTTFTVVVTDTNDCSGSAASNVFIAPGFLTLSGDTEICIGDATTLTGSGALTYSWSNGAASNSITVSPTSFSTYTLIGFDGTCFDTTSLNVLVDPLPIANTGPDVSLDLGSSVTLNAGGGVSAIWSPGNSLSCTGCMSTVASPTDTTVYFAVVTDANGCSAKDSVTVFVIPPDEVFFPNAFTPNGDGMNDLFLPILSGKTITQSLSVFNRWGQEVFFTNSAGTGWDGTFNGMPETMGVFVYYFTGTNTENGKEIEKKGNVMLVR
jgi:gliding motility-associated-like protein